MQAKVSFTQKVKEEIASIEYEDEHLRSVLAAFIKINGSLSFSNDKTIISLKTENAKIAKFIYHSIKKVYGVPCRFAYSKTMNFKKRLFYYVIIDEADYLLDDLEISFLEGKISRNIVANDDMIAGYLTGAFLASGSVNSPKNTNYHLEVALNDESYAKWFSKLFIKFKSGSFTPKIVKRRNQYVVYIKRSQQIADFLILVGATSSCLQFENVRIDRDFANIGNRLQNLDTANFNKTSNASEKQIIDIRIIDKVLGLKNLKNPKIELVAKLRLEHEDMSLNELASMASEEYGKTISKSNINHIFRSLHEMAEKYKGAVK